MDLTIHELDTKNCIIIVQNFLSSKDKTTYMTEAHKVIREQGPSVFGHKKPRFELAYSIDGNPYTYSKKSHKTIKYPSHVLNLVPKILEKVKLCYPDTTYTQLSHGVDITYTDQLDRGGSIGEHSDDELPWKMVAVISFGQSRTFRIRHKHKQEGKKSRIIQDIQTKDNSLIIMYGDDFQEKYTHEIPKLSKKIKPETRWSINLRFLHNTICD